MIADLAASSYLAVLAGDLIVAMAVGGLGIFGWQQGVFLALIAGLQVLGSFVAALAIAPAVAAASEALGCPPSQSLGVAYLVTFLGGLVATRLAIGAAVPEGAVRFAPIIDQVIGACLGAVAGFVLAGSLLVGWSLFDMPESVRLDVGSLKLDAGARLLVTFGRCVEPNPERRATLLGGDPSAPHRGLLDCYREGDWRTARRPDAASAGDARVEDLDEQEQTVPPTAPADESEGN